MSGLPSYFQAIRSSAAQRWDQLEKDPDLAGPWHQLFKQVQSPRHVLSELLQNADDAGATEASANIHDSSFLFTHNGEDFTEQHFASLCRFGYSNKRSLHTIGFRGIGFKSTFSLGDTVNLQTPTLSVSFNRDRFTEPVWSGKPCKATNTSIHVTLKDDRRQKEFEKNLFDWLHSPASLLFFRHIRKLRIGNEEVQWVSQGNGPIVDSEWIALSSRPNERFLLIRSPEEAFPADALEEIKQERMVAVGEESTFPPCRVEIVLGLVGRLFVILPTGVTTKLPFACNAPFVQDPARLKIKEPDISPTNRWLLERAGALAGKAMLAWLSNATLNIDERTRAYSLLPDVDRNDSSLEGLCATIVEQAIDETINNSKFVITETGDLVARKECLAIPEQLLHIWEYNHVLSFFAGQKHAILSRHVSEHDLKKLIHWGIVESIDKTHVLSVLKSINLPRPDSWRKLMLLWAYINEEVRVQRYYSTHTNIRIVPVQGREVLYSADEVVRLGEKKLLHSDEDWNFLADHLLVLNQNWPRFIAEQRRKTEESEDEVFRQGVEDAYSLLEKLGLTQPSDVSSVIQNVADIFFSQEECAIEDCVRLAQLAATLGATVSESFLFVARNGYLTPAKESLADINNDIDIFAHSDWCNQHVLHKDYEVMLCCTVDEWKQWVSSSRSRLLAFIPLIHVNNHYWSYRMLQTMLQQRGFDGELAYRYNSPSFSTIDRDFSEDHWDLWNSTARQNVSFWGLLLERILHLPSVFWQNAASVKIHEIANNGRSSEVWASIPPAWIAKFRNLPCLQDTRGNYRQPAELLRRTPTTESLLDVEPFVRAELDTEATRPLLELLGVRDTPTGPKRLLDRLRALATVGNPPIQEVEKWYYRLDQLASTSSTEEFQAIKEAFTHEKLIISATTEWVTISEVFLLADEEDVPDAALIHPPVRNLALWHKIGVAEKPTADLAIDWLGSIESGRNLSQDELRRVRSLLPRYFDRIWNECGHWLNLEGEWASTTELSYSISMQNLVPWKNLFVPVKKKTADFQKLSSDLCNQPPFSTLRSLAQCIVEHFEDNRSALPEPQKKLWLNALGLGLRRAIMDNHEDTQRIHELADRLAVTIWQEVSSLRTVPYIDGIPAGTHRTIDALWKDSVLYVAGQSSAKMLLPVAQALGREFNRQEISDAIKSCYDRSTDFVKEYLEENFKFSPEESPENVNKLRDTIELAQNKERLLEETATQEAYQCQVTNAPDIENEFSDNVEDSSIHAHDPSDIIDEDRPVASPHKGPTSLTKPPLIERFAIVNGFSKDISTGRFYRNDGEYLERASGKSFPWERHSREGHLLQCYCVKDACLEREPLQIEAEIWTLCSERPEKYSLILVNRDESPVVYSGKMLCSLSDVGRLTLFPATYRLVYKHEYTKEMSNG